MKPEPPKMVTRFCMEGRSMAVVNTLSAALRIDDAAPRRNRPRGRASEPALTDRDRTFMEAGSRDPMGRAQVAELVDALASGASGLTAVKVRVLSWAPSLYPESMRLRRDRPAVRITSPETATARNPVPRAGCGRLR